VTRATSHHHAPRARQDQGDGPESKAAAEFGDSDDCVDAALRSWLNDANAEGLRREDTTLHVEALCEHVVGRGVMLTLDDDQCAGSHGGEYKSVELACCETLALRRRLGSVPNPASNSGGWTGRR